MHPQAGRRHVDILEYLENLEFWAHAQMLFRPGPHKRKRPRSTAFDRGQTHEIGRAHV